jgi:hypothetical protein
MKPWQPWALGGAFMLGAGMLGGGTMATLAAQEQDASAPWIMDYEAAKAAARRDDKPIFLVIR